MAEQDDLVELAAELSRARATKRWSVEQLAGACGRSRTTVSQALNARQGRPLPSVDTVLEICRAIGIDSHQPMLLLERGRARSRLTEPGPQASDGSRQFTREPDEATSETDSLFNPLRPENLERSVQWALESATPVPLARGPKSNVGGIFALYYIGPHDLYTPISSSTCSIPLYVGAARPGMSGSGGWVSTSTGLQRVLRRHRTSIEQCDNLDVGDFKIRYLPVHEMFVAGAERLLIGDHRPVWNTVVRGFGNIVPGRVRAATAARSEWDELHPGRPWAAAMRPSENADALPDAVRRHLAVESRSVS